MAGSTLGTVFSVSTWGESHGKGVGVVIDGCPAGLPLTEQDIQIYLNRRKPGQSRFTTPRKEDDTVEILSGVFEGRTTGTPISLMVRNTSQRSKDYSEIASYYRPGHADYTYDCKYGFRDYTGREPMKQISFTATARTGRMMVKQFDHTLDVTVSVVLNLDARLPSGMARPLMETCFSMDVFP